MKGANKSMILFFARRFHCVQVRNKQLTIPSWISDSPKPKIANIRKPGESLHVPVQTN